ncbi:TIM barrel protein [Marinomonas mediterranea]|jgi:Sugar phosphate isomerases/epimerases|uniref:Xylose isomerase domain-containing protein TIM barrel n=1 Tax=Marinomonas mediterranea (strain ATCC 700492 / JCM 21426 / NBRC 103028 / MMB-1) TaxID=717774 RepID=F2JY95_MARM1|nr:TIM barrel protein [Marinomonas mediterranea]ADZ91926.1 Xylose isomerase domain-containing protein TIM barrel [Marinomonas mediterranea MMB-1]WCN13960.1 TIM barrel protein [Marinomonas mediterranea]WCN18012.1 TIM barrel protein [Marinomonas mediterranea MMB-1]
MQLELFRTLWGVTSPLDEITPKLKEVGFQGVEARIPLTIEERTVFKEGLKRNELDYIAILFTGGDVIPDQSETPQQHLQRMATLIEYAGELEAKFINVLPGNDRWPISEQVDFFGHAQALSDKAGIVCSFETHRGTSLYSPWLTLDLIRQLPELKFTMDISHWILVCERLLNRPEDDLFEYLKRVFHIQARVGYDQGAQVPHPAAPEYQEALKFHQSLWESVWQHHKDEGRTSTTMTTEFGPDGYLHHLPFTNVPVADLWSLNDWIATEEQAHFKHFIENSV